MGGTTAPVASSDSSPARTVWVIWLKRSLMIAPPKPLRKSGAIALSPSGMHRGRRSRKSHAVAQRVAAQPSHAYQRAAPTDPREQRLQWWAQRSDSRPPDADRWTLTNTGMIRDGSAMRNLH